MTTEKVSGYSQREKNAIIELDHERQFGGTEFHHIPQKKHHYEYRYGNLVLTKSELTKARERYLQRYFKYKPKK